MSTSHQKMVTHERGVITKAVIQETLQHMRTSGAPATDQLKKDYTSRLGGLLKRGLLQVLDKPEVLRTMLEAQGWSPSSALAYNRSISQWIQTLQQRGQWQEFYEGSADDIALLIRRMTRELNLQNKARCENNA